jgi:hypothetical protein
VTPTFKTIAFALAATCAAAHPLPRRGMRAISLSPTMKKCPLDLRPYCAQELHPESLIVTAEGQIQILSDDGREPVAGTACKDAPKKDRRFRSFTIAVPRGARAASK